MHVSNMIKQHRTGSAADGGFGCCSDGCGAEGGAGCCSDGCGAEGGAGCGGGGLAAGVTVECSGFTLACDIAVQSGMRTGCRHLSIAEMPPRILQETLLEK